jgi:hypothetical protein
VEVKIVGDMGQFMAMLDTRFMELAKIATIRRAFRVRVQDEVAIEVFKEGLKKIVKMGELHKGNKTEMSQGIYPHMRSFRDSFEPLLSLPSLLPSLETLESL